MEWRRCLISAAITLLMVALFCYLTYSIFLVPIVANCSFMDGVPADAPIDLSLTQWIFGNMISGAIICALLTIFSRIRSDNDEITATLIALFGLYCIYQLVWAVLGFIIYIHYYREACSYDESFNTTIEIQLYSASALFPFIIIGGLVLLCKVVKERRAIKQAHQPLINPDGNNGNVAQPNNNGSPNVYKNIYNRIANKSNQNNIN